ncbi:glycosyltransferase family 4 protein [Mucilaginibacter agri]|uniref:Glycosyltransferase n=1 Tax=Mucilaginibacter agri TaxID=2695265 RepID=A0A965ZB65_9SPHI|nr:glycosyltransferase family 4 protein [Mucilaginibacter agri]NCD67818.1 glycosyltransferase [Mucilaginibacter agri]
MQIILSHPTGNANVRAVADALVTSDMLAKYYTAIAVFRNSPLYPLTGLQALSDIRRRELNENLSRYTKTNPWFEISRLMAHKAGFKKLVQHEVGRFSVDSIYHNHDSWVARELKRFNRARLSAVYAYEDGALQTFNQAKAQGIATLYDLPIGYWRTARKLLEREIDKFPDWGATLTGMKDSGDKLARKDQELKLADHIFVASTFTARTLEDYPGSLSPIAVIPYGFPEVSIIKREYRLSGNSPLKLLFVGGLSQRKGIANLFEAVEKIGPRVQLTVVGRKPVDDCKPLNQALTKHHWIPSLSHQDVLQLMRSHDILVFPSLFEGFGLVITEAMSQGTPVITTERTAGPDLITHGEDGWIVEAGSSLELQNMIEHLLLNPDEIKKAGIAALERAKRRPWSVYANELCSMVTSNGK